MATYSYDVVIAGASFGGCAAALAAAADAKVKVVLLEGGDWVGGQATSQGITRWDETSAALTETTGSPKSYRDLRHAIRATYAGRRSQLGNEQQYFNPGFAGVGPPFALKGHPFAADPQVVRQVLLDMLRGAGVDLRLRTGVTGVAVAGGAVEGFHAGFGDLYTGKVYLDATDLGDLLPMAGVRWVIGAEARSDTGENQAEGEAHPEWIQPITVPIAVQWSAPNAAHKIARPPNYDDIRRRQGFSVKGQGDINVMYEPGHDSDTMFNYRQFIDPRNFSDGPNPRTTLNVGANDYLAAAIPTNPHTAEGDAAIVEEARQVSIAFLYYLQNDAPRDDGNGNGYTELSVDTAAFGSVDGTAPAAYVRESRRLADPYVRIVQNDIDQSVYAQGRTLPALAPGAPGVRAKNFPDSCGIGQYAADVHQGFYAPPGGPPETPNIGTPWHGIPTAPFQVPLGALLPKELSNFVAACKNIGATHITSGAYRVHPVEWAIGEAAGVLAAFCTTQNVTPATVWNDAGRVRSYQWRLLMRGTPIFWWDDVAFEADAQAFAAVQLLGVEGIFEGDGQTRNFDPGGDFPPAAREALDERCNHTFAWPAGAMTRAQAAKQICSELYGLA
ncbi:MAG TPA: FAD-dependent oxidoreductase [Candidatus Baltobacteraceae bacterium]|nr:FAD-dependent oxidoreductase [Candidatus Baltobacteraceae bacterium]